MLRRTVVPTVAIWPSRSRSWPAFGTSTLRGPRLLDEGAAVTLPAQPDHALRAPLDGPGDPPSRRIARIAGIFMVITFISIPALPFYDKVLHHANFVVGAGGDTRVY